MVGVFVGYDTPKTLGDKETGGKVAVPIFAKFIKKALVEKDSKPFLVPQDIEMIKIDYTSGKKVITENKNTIYEAFIKNTFNTSIDNMPKQNKIIKEFENNLY